MIRPTKAIRGKVHAAVVKEYPELENIEITPTVEDQRFKSDMYGFDEVLVKGVQAYIDEDIKPEYIKEGADVLGVVGNVIELQGEEKTVTPTIEQQIIVPSEGKNAITKLTVEAVDVTNFDEYNTVAAERDNLLQQVTELQSKLQTAENNATMLQTEIDNLQTLIKEINGEEVPNE